MYQNEWSHRVPLEVIENTEFLLWNGLATSSHTTYDSGIRMYKRCMAQYNILPFPATEFKLSIFVQWRMFEKKVKWNTIRSNLSAIRSLHVDFGQPFDFLKMHSLQRVMRGAKRFVGVSSDKRLPITPNILSKLFRFLDKTTVSGALYRAAFAMATFGLLRVGEFAWSALKDPAKLLTRASVAFAPNRTGIKINVNAGKTDFFREGCTICIGCRCRSKDQICAVHELQNYLNLVKLLPNDPLFRLNGCILNRDMVTDKLMELCKLANLDMSRFKSHSFRKGGATALKNAGVPHHIIQTLGRWLSDSYRLYVQYTDSDLFKYSNMMC